MHVHVHAREQASFLMSHNTIRHKSQLGLQFPGRDRRYYGVFPRNDYVLSKTRSKTRKVFDRFLFDFHLK